MGVLWKVVTVWKVVIVCIKSGYGAAFDTKMLSCAIMIRQGPRMSLRSVRGIVVDAHKLSNPIVKFKIQI